MMQATPGAAVGPARAAAPAAWDALWPGAAFDPSDRRALLVDELSRFFCSHQGWAMLSAVRPVHGGQRYTLPLDYAAVSSCSRSRDLADALEADPADGLKCLSAAAHEALFVMQAERGRGLLGRGHGGPGPVVVQLINHAPSQLHIRQLKSSCIGRLASVRGTVVRMGHIRPLITQLQFSCAKCGAKATCAFPDGRYAPPSKCPGGEGCRSRTFTPDRSTAVCVDWQKVRVQEVMGADKQQEGSVPR